MLDGEFLPEGFFICDECDGIFPTTERHITADMDGEEGDHWHLCTTCNNERG